MGISPDAREHFIEFGNILGREERAHLVEYLEARATKRDIASPTGSPHFEHCKRSIDDIFSDERLQACCAENPAVADQVAAQVLEAFEGAQRQAVVENPFIEETKQLERCRDLRSNDFAGQAESFFEFVRQNYRRADLNVGFYRKALNDHKALEKEPLRLSALKESFENDWNAQLSEKQLKWEIEQLDRAREDLCQELYTNAENFEKLKEAMLPYTGFLEIGRLWDMSHGVWRRTDFSVLSSYAQFLEREEKIKELAEMLGRLREAEDEAVEKEIKSTTVVQKWRMEHASKAELVGIHESDDLSALLPSEVALLSDPITETIFCNKFAEKKLLTFDYYDQVSYSESKDVVDIVKDRRPKDKGPIIISVDTSGSMSGPPEQVAKLMCFALLQIAIRDKRNCYLISFSTTIATLDLTAVNNSIPRLVDFLNMSFHGGTDPQVALVEAYKKLDQEGYSDADVVLISDFLAPRLGAEVLDGIKRSKLERKTKYHSLIISSVPNPDLLGIFDNNWHYDQNSSGAIVNLAMDIRRFQKGK